MSALTKQPLVLSICPGLDVFGMGFEMEGFCVVRGGDPMWGQLGIEIMHPPTGKFDGVIGGPPCQFVSRLRYLNPNAGKKHGNLIPQFERIVGESQPQWWLMENVPEAPLPHVEGYQVNSFVLDSRWIGEEQTRKRRFTFGTPDKRFLILPVSLFEAPLVEKVVLGDSRTVPVKMLAGHKMKKTLRPEAVLAGHGPYDTGEGTPQYPKRSLSEMLHLQGLPENLLEDTPFTMEGKKTLVGNAVHLQVARVLARAIKEAMSYDLLGAT